MGLRQLATCDVAGIEYLVHPQILGAVEETVRPDQIIPVVVLSGSEISKPDRLQEVLQYYVDNDDVCSADFTNILVVKPSDSSTPYCPPDTLKPFSAIYRLEGKDELPSGPYFLSGQNIHQAWRLYADELDAFTYGMIPEDINSPKRFQAVSFGIPVPSRFYHMRATPDKPLAGARVAVKDIFDVEGIRTLLSSRAWAELYASPANASAEYITKLVELGAILIGKTKTTPFSTAVEWIDFHSPINPRGDRYQEPSGSSTGAAASLAGYEWLDYSIGGDSGGSVREPATYQGLFSLRPSFGSASLDGVKTNAPSYDTVGLFGRSLDDLHILAQATLDVNPSVDASFPNLTKLLYPVDFFPVLDPVHQSLIEEFIGVLEHFLNTRREIVDLEKLWKQNPPPDSANQGLQEYLEKAPYWSLCYEYHHVYKDAFIQPYKRKFGKDPFVEKSTKFRWDIGANISEEEYDSYRTKIKNFRHWFNNNIMTDNNAIIVLPYGIAGPTYRDVAPDPPTTFKGINSKLLSPVLETPHIVIPFAQLPYESRISGETEYRPICGSLMSARGTDLQLISLVKRALTASQWPTQVQIGRYTFPTGDNSRHVGDIRPSSMPPALQVLGWGGQLLPRLRRLDRPSSWMEGCHEKFNSIPF